MTAWLKVIGTSPHPRRTIGAPTRRCFCDTRRLLAVQVVVRS